MDVSVIVATFGGREWIEIAEGRAVPSASEQAPTFHFHCSTLAAARNAGLARIRSEFAIFLDADDELTDGYVEALSAGIADLRAPSVSYVRDGIAHPPYVPRVAGHKHDCEAACLEDGNYIVIGSAIRAELLRSVGGFREEALYEDWSAWLRCYRAGATVETIPAAVYRAHWRADSRNRAPSIEAKNRVHREIVAAA